MAEEKVSEFKDRSIERSKLKNRENKRKKKSQSIMEQFSIT